MSKADPSHAALYVVKGTNFTEVLNYDLRFGGCHEIIDSPEGTKWTELDDIEDYKIQAGVILAILGIIALF